MLVALCQNERRTPLINGMKHVLADPSIPVSVRDEFRIKLLKLDAPIFSHRFQRAEVGRMNMDRMLEGPDCRLLFGINTVSHRPALHEDDRVMSVFASHRCRKSGDGLRLGLPDDLLEAGGREVVAFIHDQMPITGDHVLHDSFST